MSWQIVRTCSITRVNDFPRMVRRKPCLLCRFRPCFKPLRVAQAVKMQTAAGTKRSHSPLVGTANHMVRLDLAKQLCPLGKLTETPAFLNHG